MYTACIFDLDGTLTDTLESLAYSVNETMKAVGMPLITEEQCRQFVGNGAKVLIEKALLAGGDEDLSRFEEAFAAYGRIFDENCTYRVKPYPGIVRMLEEMKRRGNRRMGSTLTALYIDDGKAVCCNVGDSRGYLLRGGKLSQLSVDHNKAGRMVELGVLTPKQAARHPSRHELTQHLGIFADEMVIEPAMSQPVKLEDGDLFLLCSDGLTDMVSPEDIKKILSGKALPQEMVKELIQLALAGGGRDNVTAIVLQIREKAPVWRRLFGRGGGKEAEGS